VERESSGKRSAVSQSQMSGERESEKKRAECGAGGRGAVSGLNLPLMAAKACCPLYSLYSGLYSALQCSVH